MAKRAVRRAVAMSRCAVARLASGWHRGMPWQVNIDQANPLETRIGRSQRPRRVAGWGRGRDAAGTTGLPVILFFARRYGRLVRPARSRRNRCDRHALACTVLLRFACRTDDVPVAGPVLALAFDIDRFRMGFRPQAATAMSPEQNPVKHAREYSNYREVLFIVFVLFLSHWNAGSRDLPLRTKEGWAGSEGKDRESWRRWWTDRAVCTGPRSAAGRWRWWRGACGGGAAPGSGAALPEALVEVPPTGQAPSSAATDNSTSRSACGRPRPGLADLHGLLRILDLEAQLAAPALMGGLGCSVCSRISALSPALSWSWTGVPAGSVASTGPSKSTVRPDAAVHGRIRLGCMTRRRCAASA